MHKRPTVFLMLLFLAIPFLMSFFPAAAQDAPYLDSNLSVEERVDDLLARMTLEEKVGQMTLVENGSIRPNAVADAFIGGVLSGGGGYPLPNTPEMWRQMVEDYQTAALSTRLAIPMIYGVDAVHGHNNLFGATIFPHNIGLGAANDPELVEQIGRATAEEMIASSIYWDYAPVLAVPRDIRWGRTYEGYGENTELVTALGVAFLRGLQGDNLVDPHSALATIKHFVGDGGAAWGTSSFGSSNIDRGVTAGDEDFLRATYLAPYEAAIEAGARSVMISHSSWGGLPMHAQSYLINDVLKGELGFTGFTVSDWGGIDQIAPDYYQAVVTAVNAGVDMNMVPQDYMRFIDTLTQAVEAGDVTEERIDEAVRRILRVKFEMGLFEHPLGDESLLDTIGSDEHRALARQAVSESLVLLKNDNDALPIAKDTPTIFVAGRAADNIGMQSGGWTIEWQGSVGDITPGTTILEAIQGTVGDSATVYSQRDAHFEDIRDANGQPLRADVGIVVVGEFPYAEWQGDSATLALAGEEVTTIQRMRARSDKLVVILISGRPMIVDSVLNLSDAFVAAWLPGTEGQGVADVIFGDQPFTGRLPYTWPRTIDQLPFDFANLATEGCNAPLFPFGYGLDYENNSSPYLDFALECAPELEPLQTPAPANATPAPTTEANTATQIFASSISGQGMLNDFEGGLWMGADDSDVGIGIVPWGDTAENVTLSLRQLVPNSSLAVPIQSDVANNVLAISYDIESWGGFTHAITDGTNWTSEDWRPYNAMSFWLYGNNTGGIVQVEIFDNRNPDDTGDSAERWYYRITDDYEGWAKFTIPFSLFQRRTDWQPPGAPDDGLGLNEVSGYAFGFPVGVGAHTAYLDDFQLVTLDDDSEVQVTFPQQ